MNVTPHRITVLQSVLCVVVLTVVGLSVAWRSLDYAWHWDDLHLIRPHSATELARSLTGTWDPDGRETKGFRPVTVVFNDVRARVFGESVRGHRLFLIGLFAVYLVSLGALVCRFGGPWWVGLFAGVLTLCAKGSFYHYVWISDGIHLVPGLLFVAAAHLLLSYLDSGRRLLGAASGMLVLAALAAREDALALFPVLFVIGVAYLLFFERPREAYVRMAHYTVLLFLTFFAFWSWRLAVIPSAPNFRINRGVLLGPLTLFQWTVCLSGQSGMTRYGFLAAFLFLLMAACRLPRDERRHSLLWLGLAAITCLPGAVRTVANLLFFPISFYAVFAILTMRTLARASRTTAALALTLLVVVAGVSARSSRLEQLSLHPMSQDHIYRDWEAVYSKISFPSIPPARLRRTMAHLARFGIVDETFDFDLWKQDLRRRGRIGFVDDGDAFIPQKYFLTP